MEIGHPPELPAAEGIAAEVQHCPQTRVRRLLPERKLLRSRGARRRRGRQGGGGVAGATPGGGVPRIRTFLTAAVVTRGLFCLTALLLCTNPVGLVRQDIRELRVTGPRPAFMIQSGCTP